MTGIRTAAVAILVFASVSLTKAQEPARYEIRNNKLMVTAEVIDGYVVEHISAQSGSGWTRVLMSGNADRRDPALKLKGEVIPVRYTHVAVLDARGPAPSLVLSGETAGVVLRKTIRIQQGTSYAHVLVTAEFKDSVSLEYLLSTYSFAPGGPLDFVYTPQLRPGPDEVIADHTFRAPALMMQKGSLFAAMVPDLPTIDGKNRASRTGADVQVTGLLPMMSFGLLPWEKKNHVYYSHSEVSLAAIPKGTVEYGYFLNVSATAPARNGYRDIVRFHWEQFGRSNFLDPIGPQSFPFAAYVRKAWHEFIPLIALDATYEGKQVTLLRQERLAWSNKLHKAANNDNWFNVWFNSLRSAYGMYLFAVENKNDGLKQQALGNLNLALLAPQKEGIAPTVFYMDSSGGHWVADHAWGGIRDGSAYAMFHNAWTGYWLLQWADILPERRDEIIAYTGRFADFLVKQQASSGVIPSWYDPVTLEPVPEFRDENAETAGAAFFLAEYHRRTGQGKYLDAAERAMQYVVTDILPHHKWFDYETFFSCSRKPLGFFDTYTGQHPQNTLSMHQAAEAFLSLYELTGKQEYKEQGIAVMDYLCLYQQIWSPEWLSCELMGGFGVQNTDGEWSDSRQGYFAVTLVRFYELTGKREYFERGVAALRAMFSLFESPESPRTAENYAHAAADQLAGVTGFHWGTGSSVVSIHLIGQKYGEAFVDVAGQWGVGIDGCRIPSVRTNGTRVEFNVADNVASPRTIRVTFGNMKEKSYNLIVNGESKGTHSKEELQKGISIAI
ncbi:MAG: hypothetical protein WEB33_10835 [Bacteroidota bacterium]